MDRLIPHCCYRRRQALNRDYEQFSVDMHTLTLNSAMVLGRRA